MVVQLFAFQTYRGITMQYVLIAAAIFCAAFRPLSAEAVLLSRDWVTPDFFVDNDSKEHPHFQYLVEPEEKADCRAHIRQVVCVVDPSPSGEPDDSRPCLKGGSAYVARFEAVYDRFSAPVQKLFCSLNVIYIEKEMSIPAYVGLKRDRSGHVVGGARLGIQQAVLDAPDAPNVLFAAVSHQFGHLFDFMNALSANSKALYSTSQPWEDFADSFVSYQLSRDKISVTKAKHIEAFLGRSDIHYP